MTRRLILLALALGGCTHASLPLAAYSDDTHQYVPPMPPVPQPAPAPAGYQYLYGSGEGGAAALTAMHALIAYATDKAAHRPADSVVVAAGSPLVHASFVPCGTKPLAVVFDMDETLVYNLGFEARAAAGEPFDKDRWARWENDPAAPIAAVPGADHVVTDLRKLGVTPIVNTNRSAASASATIAALATAKLGAFKHGETLFLQGDGGPGSGKDGRRAAIAAKYCVIAMAGDQLGDFSDVFNGGLPFAERRQLAIHSSAAGLWGKGWFLLPNPVYGTALKGTVDEIFPPATRWSDSEEKK